MALAGTLVSCEVRGTSRTLCLITNLPRPSQQRLTGPDFPPVSRRTFPRSFAARPPSVGLALNRGPISRTRSHLLRRAQARHRHARGKKSGWYPAQGPSLHMTDVRGRPLTQPVSGRLQGSPMPTRGAPARMPWPRCFFPARAPPLRDVSLLLTCHREHVRSRSGLRLGREGRAKPPT